MWQQQQAQTAAGKPTATAVTAEVLHWMLPPLRLPLRLPQHRLSRVLKQQLRLLLPLMLHQQLLLRQCQQQRPVWVGCSQALACVCWCLPAALRQCNCPSSSPSSSSQPCSNSSSRARVLQQQLWQHQLLKVRWLRQ
jgi:hypothetical protein